MLNQEKMEREKNMKKGQFACLALLLLVMVSCSLTPADNTPSVTNADYPALTAQATDKWGQGTGFDIGNSTYFMNNQWGSGAAKAGWWQAVTKEDNGCYSTKYNWWSANGQNDTVKGFPAMIRGWHWGYKYGQGNGGLPVRVYDNKTIKTSWKITHSNWGNYECYNTAFDIWLGANNETNPANPAVEIMIWLNRVNQYPIGNYQKTVWIWGANWDLYSGSANDGKGHSWQVYSFLRKQNSWQIDNVNISDFINNLWKSNLLDGRKYICGIEAGNEIMQGNGKFLYNYYSLSIN